LKSVFPGNGIAGLLAGSVVVQNESQTTANWLEYGRGGANVQCKRKRSVALRTLCDYERDESYYFTQTRIAATQ
jgi:hypothetical protein